MLPTACVELPAFPLQLLLEDHPAWGQGPAAVVADDRPQARLLWVNEKAYRLGILPGQRYAAGLSLSGSLMAGVVSPARVVRGIEHLAGVLQGISPRVEVDSERPGAFFLDLRGLDRLHDGPAEIGGLLHRAVKDAGFEARVVLGWSRFGTYAVARGGGSARVVILSRPEQEQREARRVPLARLSIDPRLRESLAQLGIKTLGAFLDLPAAGLRERFGAEAWRLHERASSTALEPLTAVREEEPVVAQLDLDYPEGDAHRLVAIVARLLEPMLDKLGQRGEVAAGLALDLTLDDGIRIEERLQPAEATADLETLLELVRLRLEACSLSSGVVELRLTLTVVRTVGAQGLLFVDRSRRDLAALSRALARITAEFGEGSVVRAQLRDAHLPEAAFAWEPLRRVPVARPADRILPALIRRILTHPAAAAGTPRHGHDDGWLVIGVESGPVIRSRGPFLVTGGWWRREVVRAYHWIETQDGHCLWVFHDRRRRRWFVQGELS